MEVGVCIAVGSSVCLLCGRFVCVCVCGFVLCVVFLFVCFLFHFSPSICFLNFSFIFNKVQSGVTFNEILASKRPTFPYHHKGRGKDKP